MGLLAKTIAACKSNDDRMKKELALALTLKRLRKKAGNHGRRR